MGRGGRVASRLVAVGPRLTLLYPEASCRVELACGKDILYLTITAVRKEKAGDGEESVSFSRSISIPEEVHSDKVAAAYQDGVLTVTLPKREEAKPKKINIEVK